MYAGNAVLRERVSFAVRGVPLFVSSLGFPWYYHHKEHSCRPHFHSNYQKATSRRILIRGAPNVCVLAMRLLGKTQTLAQRQRRDRRQKPG